MFEQRFESDWRPIDDRYDQVQALRDLDELLARRSQLKGDTHVPAPLTPARQPVGELRNPPRKRSKGTVPAFPQEQEMERSFAGIESARDLAIFRIMYHAGLRASEVGMLELRDYSGATERMMIHRLKGSNSGEHHLNREEAAALRAWLVERGTEPGPRPTKVSRSNCGAGERAHVGRRRNGRRLRERKQACDDRGHSDGWPFARRRRIQGRGRLY